jgi:hypothetical protein
MLRREPSHDTRSISDRELGVAATLLIVVFVLAVVFVPAIG